MPRPKKWRTIQVVPKYTCFKPCGVPKRDIKNMQLKVEEIEAMRLKDIVGLNQAECAEKMSVSRQTFQLIIDSARKKVATALTEGMGIDISGGNYTFNVCHYICDDCQVDFHSKYEAEQVCPSCGSTNIRCVKKNDFCTRKCAQEK